AAALAAAEKAVTTAMTAAEKAVAAALTAAKEAVTKAEISQGKTNDNQNEFRQQLRDQAATFLPKSEYLLAHENLVDKLGIANDVIGNLRSRIDVGPPSLSTLQTRSDEGVGRRMGSEQFV